MSEAIIVGPTIVHRVDLEDEVEVRLALFHDGRPGLGVVLSQEQAAELSIALRNAASPDGVFEE